MMGYGGGGNVFSFAWSGGWFCGSGEEDGHLMDCDGVLCAATVIGIALILYFTIVTRSSAIISFSKRP